jgi:hypothetical protein
MLLDAAVIRLIRIPDRGSVLWVKRKETREKKGEEVCGEA